MIYIQLHIFTQIIDILVVKAPILASLQGNF